MNGYSPAAYAQFTYNALLSRLWIWHRLFTPLPNELNRWEEAKRCG